MIHRALHQTTVSIDEPFMDDNLARTKEASKTVHNIKVSVASEKYRILPGFIYGEPAGAKT